MQGDIRLKKIFFLFIPIFQNYTKSCIIPHNPEQVPRSKVDQTPLHQAPPGACFYKFSLSYHSMFQLIPLFVVFAVVFLPHHSAKEGFIIWQSKYKL